MMRRTAGVLLGCATLLMADPTVSSIGIGTRAYGMANEFTALSNDFSALYWNPAGLAFVPVREVHLAVDVSRQSVETECGGSADTSWQQRFRISSAGLLQSLPTSRGGYAFALGYSSPFIFDDISNSSGPDVYKGRKPLEGYSDTLFAGDALVRERSDHSTTGQCNLWDAGMGWQLAQGFSFGFAVGLLVGSEDRRNEYVSHTAQGPFENSEVHIARVYFGYDARIGFLYTTAQNLFIGCRLELPRRATVAENYTEQSFISSDRFGTTSYGTLKSSLSGAIGAAYTLPFMTLSSDITFRSPLPDALPKSDAAYWKEGIGLGVEVPVRWVSSILRGGYSYSQFDPSSMQITWDGGVVDLDPTYTVLHDRQMFTIGYTLLAGPAISLDAAYGYTLWKFSSMDGDWQNAISENHGMQRGMISLSIRY
jgi:hypothetical protein